MEDPEAVPDVPHVSFKKRATKSKSNLRKRLATPPPASDSDSPSTGSEGEDNRQIKRRKKAAGVTASSAIPAAALRTAEEQQALTTSTPSLQANSDDATKASNWYDETPNNELSAKSLLGSTRPMSNLPSEPDGNYKGTANYQSFIQRNPNTLSKQVGPIKASTNVRTITVTDFAPDVCKDYKQTGWCGFGDSCKFLHAREDYKQGWELDRDWEIGTKGKKIIGKTVASANRSGPAGDEKEDDDALLESIPFACIICKQPYKYPIVTKCGHYFCEACALQRYRKNPSCAACGAGTGGVFNAAKKLSRLLEKKRERIRKRREAAIEKGEEVGDDEEAVE